MRKWWAKYWFSLFLGIFSLFVIVWGVAGLFWMDDVSMVFEAVVLGSLAVSLLLIELGFYFKPSKIDEKGKVEIKIAVEPFLYDRLRRILKSDYCKNRGFKMTESDLIEEMIANFNKEDKQ